MRGMRGRKNSRGRRVPLHLRNWHKRHKNMKDYERRDKHDRQERQ